MIFFTLLLAISANASEVSYGSNYDSSCAEDTCITNIYSYQKYYQENSEWKQIDESFGTENCGVYDYCADGNIHQFYLSGDSLAPQYTVGEKAITFGLNSLLGSSNFSYNLIIQDNIATYKDVIPGIDLEYVYLPGEVKETIIIWSKDVIDLLSQGQANAKISFAADDAYSYEETSNGLEVSENDDIMGKIEQLVVYDSNLNLVGNFSYAIVSGESFAIEAELDLDKLQGDDIAYPIYIDPTFTLNGTAYYDLYVDQTTDPPIISFTQVDSTRLVLGYQKSSNSTEKERARIDIGFDIFGIPDDAKIKSANLSFYVTRASDNNFNNNITLWHMSTNNNTFQSYVGYWTDMGDGSILGSYEQTTGTGTYHNFNLFNATSDITANLQDNVWNVGIHVTQDTGTPSPANILRWFYASSTDSNQSRRPRFTIVYQFNINETDSNDAIEQGIFNVALNAVIHDNQQVYIRLANGTQELGRFDRFALNGSKRWAFNYITGSEEFTNMKNVTPVFYMLEMIDINFTQVVQSVQEFINGTL